MYKIFYWEDIYPHFHSEKEKCFDNLQELEDWMFSKACKKSFDSNELNIDIHAYPDESKPSPIWINLRPGYNYGIYKITNDKGIVFSNGHSTGGQAYWNNEIKQFLLSVKEHAKNPVYNFV